MKKFFLVLSIFFLLIFRLFLTVNSKHGDMYNNLDWGRAVVNSDLSAVYDLSQKSWPHSWPNQPPGSLLFHGLSLVFSNVVNTSIWYLNTSIPVFPSQIVWWWEQHGELLAIKLPSVIADFVTAGAILYLGKKFQRKRLAGISAFIYLVNPAIWYDSSYWGQTDPIVTAFSTWSLVTLLSGRLALSPVFLALSLITKASWAPLLPLYFIYWLKKYPKQLAYLLLIPGVMLLVSWPFHPHLNLLTWLVNLFLYRILPGESNFITVIAFNFWNLVFGPGFLPASTPFLGLPANLVGWGLVGFYLICLIRRLWKNTTPENFLYSIFMLFFMVFLFAPKMIHRYFFPVFPVYTAWLIFKPDLKNWLTLCLLSVLFIINLYYQWWSPGIPELVLLYTPAFTKTISLIYLSVFTVLHVQKN